ncbi:MAG: hypothetical protein NC305_13295 [Lachnospiraceae bacterium]|nr:hypothetical protein [Butyrivibrio sp.]MCM1344027.1 hypothetical protein [Muribaculaceae bacterium]MCM1411506.1 hypothetical protein [Lachnospiraceae bacterium]
MIRNGLLAEFIENLLCQVEEDQLWELYLATALMQDRSFEEWKTGITTNQEKPQPVEEYTPGEAVARAEGILAGFQPF